MTLGLSAAAVAHATTQDITSQFAITRSALVLNRATGTYDSAVDLRNASAATVPAPINAAVGGLAAPVTLANKTSDTPDGKPYLSPMAPGSILAPGDALAFALRFADPGGVAFTSTLQILYTIAEAPNAPSLIGVAAAGGTTADIVGRIDGAPNARVTLQVYSATSCFLGSLVGASAVGGTVEVTTDAQGYFAVAVGGINPGGFVAVKNAAAGSPSSTCLASARDNDSWPRAFTLDGSPVSVQDLIDAPGKSRWYKFPILPGQRIDVALSGLAADYDLAVFKDIEQAFLRQFDPATAGTRDLLKLTAEAAPSMFSPSMFSPSMFSPDAFSPSMFSPSAFSSSVFSPSMFSPSMFSPSMFSPSAFSPSFLDADEIVRAFSTAQTRSIIAISATPGKGDESATVNTWNETGYFYVRVAGRGGAFDTSKPFTLTITKGPTTCAGITDFALNPRSPVAASGRKTVILTDSSVVALDVPLPGAGGATLRDKLTAFAARADIAGVVIDVASDARVGTLKAQAAANPACPFAKNLVAQEIKGIVATYKDDPLRYVVIAGNDDAIPFFRSPDQSGLGDEDQYVPPVQSNSPSDASLRLDFVLSQDRYGSTTEIALPANQFPVPKLAVGRLVETADEIAAVIDAYVAVNGVVVPSSALVTGYDFLADAATEIRDDLKLGLAADPDTLITPNGTSPQSPASWTAAQLRTKLFGSRHDLIFLAGHFSANNALAADFTTSIVTTELVASAVDLTNALVYSAGCHSGYNLVDAAAISGVTLALDWAQAFARKKAALVAGTGYQYGDTDFLAYSELLYLKLTRALRTGAGPIAIGDALVRAKLDYLGVTTDIRGISEKVLLEATLFGLPMLAIDMPGQRITGGGGAGVITPVPVPAGPAHDLGLRTASLDVSLALTSHPVPLKNLNGGPDITATYLSGPDGVVTKPGEPALPLDAVDVTPTDSSVVLRGVGFRSGTYVDSAPLYAFSGAPTTELRGVHVAFLSPVFYPARMWTPNYFGALAGNGGTDLLVTPAQHRAANIAAGTSTQRKFTNLGLRLYYSGNLTRAALSDAPTIIAIDAQPDVGGIVFAAEVVGDPAAAIFEVWITYTGDGTGAWASLDLVQCVAPLPAICGGSEDSRMWKGRLAGTPANIRYMVQAVSGVGLVATDDNHGAFYGIQSITPQATTIALLSPPANAAIGDKVDVTARLTFAGIPLAGKTVIMEVGDETQFGVTAADGSATVKVSVAATPGTYLIAASFAGDDAYEASSTTASFVVSKAPSSLARLAPNGAVLTGSLGGKTVALQQESVSFAVTGPVGPQMVFVITDYLGRAPLLPPGTPAGDYTVTQASFGGNDTYAATSVTFTPAQSITVAKTAQTITFDPLPDRSPGDPPFDVFATASSGLGVTFGASGACTVAGSTVHLTGAGSCTITANQAGDANTSPAPQVTRTFSIGPTVVSLVRAMPSPTMADSVTYTLTFSEAVTGVATANFAVTTAGITGASVASVSGSGTTRTVTVNTGRGTGTLRLDVANGTGIVDAGNVVLHGTPFTGETYDIDKGGALYGADPGKDGPPVAGFGSGGYQLFGNMPVVSAGGQMAVLPDGRIWVASTVDCSALNPSDPASLYYCTLQLARYFANGAFDGLIGSLLTGVNNVGTELSGIHVNDDGTFLVGGFLYDGTNNVPFVAKFTTAGAADTSFGTNGVAVLSSLPIGSPTIIVGFAVDASGRSVVASTTPSAGPEGTDIFVTRLTTAGALDATFGTGGVAQFAISSIGSRNDRGTAVAVQPDGKIIVGGRTIGPQGFDFLVLRIDAAGARDPTFGTNGGATTRFAGTLGSNVGRKLVLQEDGKIVLVGTLDNGTAVFQCGIARFNANGTLDAGFGAGGQVVEPRLDQGCFNVSLQPDGKTVIVGNASDAAVNIGGFLRLRLDGSPDPTFGHNGGFGISNYDTPAPVAVTASGNLLTMLTRQDPVDGVIKSYVVELGSTLAGPSVAQSITFDPLPDVSYGTQAFELDGTASSGLPVSYTASGVCVVAGDTVSIGGVGSCTITARQPGDGFYTVAPHVVRTFNIGMADQAISFGTAPSGVTVGQPLVFVNATSTSPTAPPSTIPISFTSLTPAVCTAAGVNFAIVVPIATGTCTIAADEPGNDNYNSAPEAMQSFAVGPVVTPPSTFTVTSLADSGTGSLRAAVAAANAAAPGPNIVDLTGLIGTISLTTGQIKISRSVTIQGPGSANLTIDAGKLSRIFSIFVTDPACGPGPAFALDGPDYLVFIQGVRLTQGWQTAGNTAGAIFTEHSLWLDDVVIDNSVARNGGGLSFFIQYQGQTLTITNSKFQDNLAGPDAFPAGTSSFNGGAINVTERCSPVPATNPVTVMIADTVFTGNFSEPNGSFTGNGGAINAFSLADITITDSRLFDNHVEAATPPVAGFNGTNYRSGAIHATARSLLIERSEIAENSVDDASLPLSDTTRAGAMNVYNDDPDRQGPGDVMAFRIIESTISGNSVAATGGAMTVYGNVALELYNSTVANNSAAPTRTGGIIMSTGATQPSSGGNATPPTLKLVSTILANNSSNSGDLSTNTATIPAFAVNASNSLIRKKCLTCAIVIPDICTIPATPTCNLFGVDPLLDLLDFYGGLTRTHALLTGSPAIDKGANPLGLPTDQRGDGFDRVVGPAADMGAFEYTAP